MTVRSRKPRKEKEAPRENEEFLFTAELRALRYILQYPDNSHHFRPSLFTHKESRVLYDSVQYLLENKLTLSTEAIAQEANKRESKLQLTAIKGLLEQKEKFSDLDRDHLVRELSGAETKEDVAKKLEKALAIARTSSVPDEEFFNQISLAITDAQMASLQRSKSTLITIDQALERYVESLDERERGSIALSGDLLLDRALTRKVAGGQIILIAAATGAGKSLYVLNLINGFINLDVPSIYITLEMDLESTIDREMSLRLGVSLNDWYDQDKIVTLKKRVLEEKKKLKSDNATGCRVEIVEDPSLYLADISSLIAEFRAKHRIPLRTSIVVAVDLITQVRDFSEGRNGYSMAANYEIAVNYLNIIAKAQNVCFLATAQVNRDADNVPIVEVADVQRTRPTLNTVKNSHALAERSRAVLGLWRPRYYLDRYLPDDPMTPLTEDILEVTVLKQSQGAVGQRLNYTFHGETASIVPLLGGAGDSSGLLTEEEQAVMGQVHF